MFVEANGGRKGRLKIVPSQPFHCSIKKVRSKITALLGRFSLKCGHFVIYFYDECS
ncbi:hypothetical protein ACU6T4_11060 [Avibacterium paragallinarum]|uniref:hypothetical protein n=1 Tax=Avibacterium paragallinarum TaxID=728 RepID=UPI00021AD1D0|nr:hypothetical protein [Avibacterium paragallinarum]QIR12696.1 hypothetical protein HBL79_11030 [Avibacterium paragallinarum]QJE10420.1 hypothetical protein HHJ62_09080 [Avibacterium paragallinarum]QJE12613.1 hypothetical protein HHJ61_09085 [Avibacterium paragallinarum]QJE14817.1 hypothetical protein HHJ60_09110 [Avibacterium paragallinarum]QJE17014.1 hypothetical protein HHJ59_09090 [Avibacterium paragallinarum]